MILVNGVPGRLVPCLGTYGIVGSQVAPASDFPSVLDNDQTSLPDRANAERLWTVTAAVATGATSVDDFGALKIEGLPDGISTMTYKGFWLPTTGAPVTEANTITINVQAPDADTTPPVMGGSISISALTSTGYTMAVIPATDNVGVTGYEYSLNGGTSWVNSGTSRTVVITGRSPGSTDSVRWRAFDAAGNRAVPLEAEVDLAAVPDPTFSQQPVSQAVSEGGSAVIAWATSGDGPITSQVRTRANSGSAWEDVSGATTSPYTTPALALVMSGRQYQVVATGPNGNPVYSAIATVTVQSAIVSPTLSVASGEASSPVTAVGQVSTNKSGGVLRVVASTGAPDASAIKADGAVFPVLTIGAQSVTVSGLSPSTSGYRLHFIWTDADGADSAVVRSAFFDTPSESSQGSRLPMSVNDYFDLLQRIAVSQA